MTNYNSNCKTVDAYPKDGDYTDVVYNVHWIVTGTSDSEGVTYSATSIGTQILDTSEITDFIPFDELTNEQVVSWTKSTMGEEQVDGIEAGIQSEIDNLINPTSVTLTIGESE